MVGTVDEEEKDLRTIFVDGRNYEMWFLTEDGLYEVLMQSRKPIAKEFKKGVKEILKTIRKTGGYLATKQDDTPEEIMARALTIAQTTLAKREERLKQLEAQAELPGRHCDGIQGCRVGRLSLKNFHNLRYVQRRTDREFCKK